MKEKKFHISNSENDNLFDFVSEQFVNKSVVNLRSGRLWACLVIVSERARARLAGAVRGLDPFFSDLFVKNSVGLYVFDGSGPA